MSDLINRIRAAQRQAGEDVVMQHLRRVGLADECQTRAERDAPAARAASAAAQAAAKAANAVHTEGPWRVGRAGAVVSDHAVFPNSPRGFDEFTAFGGHVVASGVTAANARRIVACVNACAGVPTETLELAASWGDIVKGVMGGARIPAEAARIGAGLDGESLEQGEPL